MAPPPDTSLVATDNIVEKDKIVDLPGKRRKMAR